MTVLCAYSAVEVQDSEKDTYIRDGLLELLLLGREVLLLLLQPYFLLLKPLRILHESVGKLLDLLVIDFRRYCN
jgi:hypothetical protein